MNDEPTVSITYEVPLSVLRKWRRHHDRDRSRYTRWLDNCHDDDGNSFLGGAAKLAALDVELPPELPEVGRRIRLGPNHTAIVEGAVSVSSGGWIWGRYSVNSTPATYRLPKEWTYVD